MLFDLAANAKHSPHAYPKVAAASNVTGMVSVSVKVFKRRFQGVERVR